MSLATDEVAAVAFSMTSGAAGEWQWLSFGASSHYFANGGHRVLTDDCDGKDPVDLSVLGLRCADAAGIGATAVAAYTLRGSGSVQVRIRVRCEDLAAGIFVRATAGPAVRVTETLLSPGRNGIAEADLTVVGLPLGRTGIIDESWKWSFHAEGAAGPHDLPDRQADPKTDTTTRVRIYVTAGAPRNPLPRESFYHVACDEGGATDVAGARAAVWRNFTRFRSGGFVTNARGQQLGYWKTEPVSDGSSGYSNRTAADLVRLTDSSCFGWAGLLAEAFRIHGMDACVRGVQPRLEALAKLFKVPVFALPDANGQQTPVHGVGILIKPFRWSAAEAIIPAKPGRNDMIESGDFPWKVNHAASHLTVAWPKQDAHDLGRPCQGWAHPRRGLGTFADHAVTLLRHDGAERWYDPSYGLGPHPSLESYERDLLGKREPESGGIFAVIGCRFSPGPGGAPGARTVTNLARCFIGAMPAPDAPLLQDVESPHE